MKKYKIALAAFAMLFTCNADVSAQKDLGNLLGNIIEHAKNSKSSKTDSDREYTKKDGDSKNKFFEGLSNIFNKDKVASENDLVGKWKFTSPAIIFDSESALEKMGGKLAAQRMETKINDLLNKYGIIKEAMTIEFTEDGSFLQTYKKLNLKGTYSVVDNEVVLKYAGRYKQLVGSTQIDGNDLVIVMDVEKLNEYLVNITRMSNDPKAQVISKLLSRVKGLKCGMRFDKQ